MSVDDIKKVVYNLKTSDIIAIIEEESFWQRL